MKSQRLAGFASPAWCVNLAHTWPLFIVCLLVVSGTGRLAWGQPRVRVSSRAGSLVIVGGGRLPAEVIQTFVQLAGGDQGHLVVIPTASGSADQGDTLSTTKLWEGRGLGTVTVMHTRDREEADRESFYQPLIQATAVWFSGGSQQRISEAYLGTAVEERIMDLFARGGVVGGTSAGAAIQSRVMIRGGTDKALVSTGFDLLHGSVIDQHFRQRNRQARLRGVIREHRHLIGFGIDESTALILSAGKARVLGKNQVTAYKMADEALRERAFPPNSTIDPEWLVVPR